MFSYVHLMIQANIECSGVMFDSKLNWNVHIPMSSYCNCFVIDFEMYFE